MILDKELVTISHGDSNRLRFDAKIAEISFPDPNRTADEPGGKVDFWPSDSFATMDFYNQQNYEFGPFVGILRCNWSSYNRSAQIVMRTYVNAAIGSLTEVWQKKWNFDSESDFIDFLINDTESAERETAKNFEMDFNEYGQDRIYPKLASDFFSFKVNEIVWKCFVTCNVDGSQQYVSFALPISASSYLLINVQVEMLRQIDASDEDIHTFKQHLVEDYLRHIKVVRR